MNEYQHYDLNPTDSLFPDESEIPMIEQADGSAIFDLSQGAPSPQADTIDPLEGFYDNIAEQCAEDDLKSLAQKLLEQIKEDDDSRAQWLHTVELAMKYLGFKLDDFKGGDGSTSVSSSIPCYDSSLATALMTSYATAKAELFPVTGPCRSEIIGISTEEVANKGDRVKDFMNLFLTKIVPDYYKDSEKLLIYTIFTGSGFRKVYQDPILNRPDSRFIRPQDFIVNHHTTSLMHADRITEIFYLNRQEIALKQQLGVYLEDELPKEIESTETIKSLEKTIQKIEGYDKTTTKNKSLFKFYECHVALEDDEFLNTKETEKDEAGIQKPYIVTINADTKKIVSIKRNWEPQDNTFKRNEYYVHYYYLPSFGLYSIGLAHLIGTNAIALTSILRQSIDAGVFSNFPGFLKKKGITRQSSNDLLVRPGEAVEIDTGDLPIQQCIMNLPYKEPSQVLIALRQELKNDVDRLSAATQSEIPEIGANAPVGTTLALLEVSNKVQSTVLRSLHYSLGQELSLLFNLFGKYLPDTPYPFAVPGSENAIMRQDFSEMVNIVPVSDPNVLTSAHRLILSDSIRNIASAYPELHNMREVLERSYRAMNVENIDKLLVSEPEPVSLDPLSENISLQLGKAIAVSPHQNDAQHIAVHEVFVQENASNQNLTQVVLNMSLHIQAHKAMSIIKQYQMPVPQMGDAQLLQIPEIQNILAEIAAQEEPQRFAQQQAQQQSMKPIEPQQVMLQDIEQRREASLLKHEESKLNAETESFKAQLKFESEQNKMEQTSTNATERNETDLKVAALKNKT